MEKPFTMCFYSGFRKTKFVWLSRQKRPGNLDSEEWIEIIWP